VRGRIYLGRSQLPGYARFPSDGQFECAILNRFSFRAQRNILVGQHMRVVPMNASQPTIQTKFAIARRSCPICGKDMRITRITPERPGFEQRTFECATCGDETILMGPIRYGRETPWNPR
jgi:transcription elongation factor Elf1